ncbi:hypothetical protein BC827DRAFT_253164 [Russula dissimulans]|nr:hypothetical protein BC827DRAFT_253164 [Russula dissimulans]
MTPTDRHGFAACIRTLRSPAIQLTVAAVFGPSSLLPFPRSQIHAGCSKSDVITNPYTVVREREPKSQSVACRHLNGHASELGACSTLYALQQRSQLPLRFLTMGPLPADTTLLVAHLAVAIPIAGSSTTSRTAAPARTFSHKLGNETRNGRLADLRHGTRAPPPLPRHVAVLARAILLRRAASAATTALLRGSACTATACTDASTIEVALTLELGKICLEGKRTVWGVRREVELRRRAEAQTAEKGT